MLIIGSYFVNRHHYRRRRHHITLMKVFRHNSVNIVNKITIEMHTMSVMDDDVKADIVTLLSNWYSHQLTNVCWKSSVSSSFHYANGTRQGNARNSFCLNDTFVTS